MHPIERMNEVRLLSIKYRPRKRGYDTRNQSNDFLFILPLVHSSVKLEIDGTVIHDGPVQPGMVRIVRPGECAQLTPRSAFESVLLAAPRDALEEIARSYGLALDFDVGAAIRPLMDVRHDVQRLVPLLRTAAELPDEQRSLLTFGLVLTLLALALNSGAGPSYERGPGFEPDEFEKVLDFARSRLSERLDLSEWSDIINLSTNEFARRFQQHTGVAPYTWFMDQRIDEAKRLMMESDLPLVEVALDAGFCSQSHFTEAFRRRVGTSPGRWRTVRAENGVAKD